MYTFPPSPQTGETALHLACKFGMEHIVSYLVTYPQLNIMARNGQGLTPAEAVHSISPALKKRIIDTLQGNNPLPPCHKGTLITLPPCHMDTFVTWAPLSHGHLIIWAPCHMGTLSHGTLSHGHLVIWHLVTYLVTWACHTF